LAHNAIEVRKTGDWFHNLEYDAERERGMDFSEDLFNPFTVRFDLRLHCQASIIASTEQHDVAQGGRISAGGDHTSPKSARRISH
jgi:hypothetical protein